MVTLVIDPGHGQADSGAIGPSGVKEKDVNLQVALRMREKLLGISGLTVIMTRDTDRQVSLSARAEFANEAGANLFLSIHCNSAKETASGFEAFSSHGHTQSDLAAGQLLEAYAKDFPHLKNRGAKEAAFAVLTLTTGPAVLFELEFIHTPAGEAWLSDPDIQDRMASALCRGALAYLGLGSEPVEPPGPSEDLELIREAIAILRLLEEKWGFRPSEQAGGEPEGCSHNSLTFGPFSAKSHP